MSAVVLPLELFIDCDPAPKGSVKADPNGHIRHTRRSVKLERLIKDACLRRSLEVLEPFADACVVVAEFVIRQPRGDVSPWPIARRHGDIDKHPRTLLDGITGPLIVDDAQVVHLDVSKRWAAPMERTGIRLWLREPIKFVRVPSGEIGEFFDRAMADALDRTMADALMAFGIMSEVRST